MATIDLIGKPFPKNHPLFRDDRHLAGRINQIESYIEIKHDVIVIERNINTMGNIVANKDRMADLGLMCFEICDSLAISSVILYARMFNSSCGRTKLESSIFNDPAGHNDIMEFRSNFLAHRLKSGLNDHCLNYFIRDDKSAIQFNPSGFTQRAIVYSMIDWSLVRLCLNQITTHVDNKIANVSSSIIKCLSRDQLEFLISSPASP